MVRNRLLPAMVLVSIGAGSVATASATMPALLPAHVCELEYAVEPQIFPDGRQVA